MPLDSGTGEKEGLIMVYRNSRPGSAHQAEQSPDLFSLLSLFQAFSLFRNLIVWPVSKTFLSWLYRICEQESRIGWAGWILTWSFRATRSWWNWALSFIIRFCFWRKGYKTIACLGRNQKSRTPSLWSASLVQLCPFVGHWTQKISSVQLRFWLCDLGQGIFPPWAIMYFFICKWRHWVRLRGGTLCFNRPRLAYHLSAGWFVGWLVGFIINFISRALLGSEQNWTESTVSIYSLPQHIQPPLLSTSCTRVGHSLLLMNPQWYIITQSPWLALTFTLGVVHFTLLTKV